MLSTMGFVDRHPYESVLSLNTKLRKPSDVTNTKLDTGRERVVHFMTLFSLRRNFYQLFIALI